MGARSFRTDIGARGFSLVELLVVLAVIVLLIALLLPALRGARETARAIGCASQLRQLYLVTVNYTEDYDGYAYSANAVAGHPGDNWSVLLASHGYLDGIRYTYANDFSLYTADGGIEHAYFLPDSTQRASPPLLYCPSDPVGFWYDHFGGGNYHTASYSANIYVFGYYQAPGPPHPDVDSEGNPTYHSPPTFMRIFDQPERFRKKNRNMILIAAPRGDGAGGRFAFYSEGNTDRVADWHNGAVNLLHLQGNVSRHAAVDPLP